MRSNFTEGAKLLYRMPGANQCTTYCLANLLGEDHTLDLKAPIPYTSPGTECDIFKSQGLNLYQYALIHPAFGNFEVSLATQIFNFVVNRFTEENKGYIVYLVRVSVPGNAIHNVLLIMNLENGNFLTVDPAKEHVAHHTTITSFEKFTGSILGISVVTDHDCANIKIWSLDLLSHLLS